MELPIACTLTEVELRERRQAIMDTFSKTHVSVSELPDGYAYSFAANSDTLSQIAELVVGPEWQPLLGPERAKQTFDCESRHVDC